MKLLAVSAFLMVVPSILSENIFLPYLKPEEAQKYIANSDLSLKYAPKIGESPLPLTRSHNGDTIYRGRKISNPGDYIEEHYLANQFHGQDGLGRALFGYSDWNQGRVEAINGNNDVRGSYKYVDANGNDFHAKYWADSLGFHQEDNRPKVVLEPVTDTPAVQRARDEHFRKWHEAANQARQSPDPNSDYYNSNANRYDEHQDQLNQAQEIYGAQSNRNDNYANRDYSSTTPNYEKYRDPEPTGPPHGFFYNIDYPVHLLRNVKTGRTGYSDYYENQQSQQYNSNNNNYNNPNQHYNQQYNQYEDEQYKKKQYGEHQQYKRSSAEEADASVKIAPATDAVVDAVHDAQVSPKQRAALENPQASA